MSHWWVSTELGEFGGFQRDWYGPYPSESEAEAVAMKLSKQDLVAETVFGPLGRDGARFAEFVGGRRYNSGASGWYAVKPKSSISIPATANGKYPAS